jgi:hypothetical protein
MKIQAGKTMKVMPKKVGTMQNRSFMNKLSHTWIVISSLLFLAMACESKARDTQSSVSNLVSQRPEHAQSSTASKEIAANSRRTKRIQFEPGASAAVVENAVVRGSRDIYLLRANKGQRLHGQITSTENNAVIDVLTPGGKILRHEVTKIDMPLPSTGDFQIAVGGTRGNASYRLNIGVD